MWDGSRGKAIRDAQLAVNLLHKLGFSTLAGKVQLDLAQSLEMLGTQVTGMLVRFRVPLSSGSLSHGIVKTLCASTASTSVPSAGLQA